MIDKNEKILDVIYKDYGIELVFEPDDSRFIKNRPLTNMVEEVVKNCGEKAKKKETFEERTSSR